MFASTYRAHDTLVCSSALVAPQVAGGAPGTIEAGSMLLTAGFLMHPAAVVTLPDTASAALTGAQVVDTLILSPALSQGQAVTLPAAADIIAAFAAAGKPLVVGDSFSFYLARGATGAFAVTLSGNTGTTFSNGASSVAIARYVTCHVVCTLATATTITVRVMIGRA